MPLFQRGADRNTKPLTLNQQIMPLLINPMNEFGIIENLNFHLQLPHSIKVILGGTNKHVILQLYQPT